ncbi:MAG: hypothetical protein GXO39_01665 [Thermotogae bacterium]|nr:hypothetical protein [Thermotogota bacterium]
MGWFDECMQAVYELIEPIAPIIWVGLALICAYIAYTGIGNPKYIAAEIAGAIVGIGIALWVKRSMR